MAELWTDKEWVDALALIFSQLCTLEESNINDFWWVDDVYSLPYVQKLRIGVYDSLDRGDNRESIVRKIKEGLSHNMRRPPF